MRKRNHIIPLHLNKKELAHLETQVKQSGLPREEFLRPLIMGAELRARPCEHHADLLAQPGGVHRGVVNILGAVVDLPLNTDAGNQVVHPVQGL